MIFGSRKPAEKSEVLALYEEIEEAFPRLTMIIDEQPEHVDLRMEIPVQVGLRFPIGLNLQGDELHLTAGSAFWLEWFPGYEERVKMAYLSAVKGLLEGRLRILEHRRGERVVKAELQEPGENGWTTIGSWGLAFWLPIGRKDFNILQNVEPGGPSDIGTEVA